jgi:hypothetical protein
VIAGLGVLLIVGGVAIIAAGRRVGEPGPVGPPAS